MVTYENEHSAKYDEQNFEYRKVQTILGDVSFSLVLPKQYAIDLGLRKGDFVKVQQEGKRIVIEKVES